MIWLVGENTSSKYVCTICIMLACCIRLFSLAICFSLAQHHLETIIDALTDIALQARTIKTDRRPGS